MQMTHRPGRLARAIQTRQVSTSVFRHKCSVVIHKLRRKASWTNLASAAGITDAYWEFRLKPWDCAAGVLMVTEAGGVVSTMAGEPYTVFHR